jgi:hypothetical protein
VLIFDRIVLALRVPGQARLLVAMGFTPWLIVTSTATLDYHWALTAMLSAYLATIRRRYALAGLLLASLPAAGSRRLRSCCPWACSSSSRPDARGGGVRRPGALPSWVAWQGRCALGVPPRLRVCGTDLWNYAPAPSLDVVIQMVGQRGTWGAGRAGDAAGARDLLARLAAIPACCERTRTSSSGC